ncbi:MAG: molybdenum cofactor guanylyltransferase [Deltaproteobacteria bacterium]
MTISSDNATATSKPGHIQGIAGVILAGGESQRMGRNKAMLAVGNERIIESVYRCLSGIFEELLLVTNTPEVYDFIPCSKVRDIFPGMGPLAGIHAALSNCLADRAFVTGCDMPSLNASIIRELCSMPDDLDVVIPETQGGLEPLHSVYSKRCLPKMRQILDKGDFRILSFFDNARIRLVPRSRVALLDPDFSSFRNINTPEDYRLMAGDNIKAGEGN